MLCQPEVIEQTAPAAHAIFKSAPIQSETSSELLCVSSSGETDKTTMLTIRSLSLQFQFQC